MTIREMQYAIQDAIDKGDNGVTDDCILETSSRFTMNEDLSYKS